MYRFTFNDETLEFRIEWVGGSPLPVPSITNMSLVGDFNNWTPSGNSLMTNNPVNTNLWQCEVDLQTGTAFQFRPNEDENNQWGAPATTTVSIPVTNGSACGSSDFNISSLWPGIFRFELDVSNAVFTVTQVETQAFTISTMTVQGSFVATTNPPANMMQIGETLWQSDHYLTNNGTVTLRFSANSGLRIWGATNTSPQAMPVSDVMPTGLTAHAQISGVVPGRYRITFDHQSGAFSFRQVYTEADGLNLLDNPGFEQTTEPDGGYAVDWGSWQAWPKRVADGYLPHSGNWCGAIHGKLFQDWDDYGSFAQDVTVTEGLTYRASAWFKATPDWVAASMQIKMEWLDSTNGPLGGTAIEIIESLTDYWVQYAAEGQAPEGAAKAHVVFLCAGADTQGTMHIDDAEVRVVASRTQNFDSWGALTNFAAFSPDWSITSGRTVWNVPPGRPEGAVMISQYVEGTGNNKAIELFNGTLDDVNLAADGYYLQQFNNGSLTPSVSIPLTGTFAQDTCLVFGRQDTPTNYAPDPAISDLDNLVTNKYITFNGDDVIILRKYGPAGTVIDRVGQVGTNATGSIWSRNTTDHTLTRKSTIFTGTTNSYTDVFPLLDEWEIRGKDNFTDLGTHELSFLDPNEPYTPAGYSLIMDSGATLMSGELPGGIGDVSFWWRTESMAPALTLAIETAPTDAGPWTEAVILTNVAASNFAYYAVAINRADHSLIRFRQADAGTNRFRIDEITVTEPSEIKRLEDFSGWTDPAFEIPGSYSRYSWSIENASIAPTSGSYNTRAALLSPPDGAVISPAYEGGVGEVVFWAKAEDEAFPAYLQLQTTIDGGTNWVTQQSYTVSTADTHSIWLYLTNNPSQARFVFNSSYDSGDVYMDNIEVRVPALYRDQDFNGWPYKPSYSSGTSFFRGWEINNCIVDGQYAYSGMAGRLNQSTSGDAWIESPYLPDGIGPISFRINKTSPSATSPTVQVQVSPNGVGWTSIGSFTATSTNWALCQLYWNDTTNSFVRLVHTAGASAVPIDNIEIGSPQPRPQIAITPNSDPVSPGTNDTVQITADIITQYGASILSVTGYYKIASSPWMQMEMTTVAYGSYATVGSIPALPPSVTVQYYVQAQYTGIGAEPGSSGFSTNLTVSSTNAYQISSVQLGDVWINEISYLNVEEDWFVWPQVEDAEFIELCGKAGSDISGWTIQLAFGADIDIVDNGNQPVYANYPISSHTFTNQTNGFSFYVLGDLQLQNSGEPVDIVLDTYVPTNVAPYSVTDHDHVHNDRGVIRLLNEYSNVVYSLSYGGYASGSDPIPTSQELWVTNSVSLTGTGSSFDDFISWNRTNFTIGAINEGQTLEQGSGPELAIVWHIPEYLVTPENTNVPPFTMRDPLNAQSKDDLRIHYGFPDPLYTLPSGTLYYRAVGESWQNLSMAFLSGSRDADTNSYVQGIIPLRTFPRATSIEYVIEAVAGAGTAVTYIGLGSTNDYALFETLAEAQAAPFTFTYQMHPEIIFTNISTNAASWVLHTIGNDVLEPYTHFEVQVTTNLLTPVRYIYDGTNIIGTRSNTLPPGVWETSSFSNSAIDAYGGNIFYVPKDPAKRRCFFRINALWP